MGASNGETSAKLWRDLPPKVSHCPQATSEVPDPAHQHGYLKVYHLFYVQPLVDRECIKFMNSLKKSYKVNV